MIQKLPKYSFFLVVLSALFYLGCASTGSPNGGPKDTEPPVLVTEKSEENFQTNYRPEEVKLVFDEWIELKNQRKEVLVSPPFFQPVKISQRGKKVKIEFPEDEPLKDDATYVIDFGKSVVDFTEGNPAEDLKFVFSTGDKIHELSMSGSVVDAVSGEPVPDVLVFLYDEYQDSVVLNSRPFYFTKTQEDGTFKFDYLRADTFDVIVLEDLNYNYNWEDRLERIAFIDSSIVLHDSAIINDLDFRLFLADQGRNVLNSNSKTPGKIVSIINKEAALISTELLYPKGLDLMKEIKEDSIFFWFREDVDSLGIIFGMDTLDFYPKAFDTVFYNKSVQIKEAKELNNHNPYLPLPVLFGSPIVDFYKDKIILSDKPKMTAQKPSGKRGEKDIPDIDTLENAIDSSLILKDTVGVAVDSFPELDSLIVVEDTLMIYEDFSIRDSSRFLIFDHEWKANHEYQILFLPGALTDMYGRSHDTLKLDFKTYDNERYGRIKLFLEDIGENEQFILKLIDGVEKEIFSGIFTAPDSIVLKDLKPGKYTVKYILDENKDGLWTTGDYWKKIQPEKERSYELEELKENWDLEAKIFWVDPEVSMPIDSIGSPQDSILQLPGKDEIDKGPINKPKTKRGGKK